MPPEDIRIKISFFNHYKTKLLHRQFGDSGITSLWKLWAYCAVHQQDGNLSKWDEYRLQLACERDADCMQFIDFLASDPVRFLDRKETKGEKTLKIHDWKDHQPWVYFSKKRSKIASKNASKRWNGKGKNNNANSMQSAQTQHTIGNAPSPSPSPSPSLKEGGKHPRKLDKISFEKAEIAWLKFEKELNKPPDQRIIISDNLSRKIYHDIGQDRIMELHGQNGGQLHQEFIARYSVLEQVDFMAKSTTG